MSLQVWLPFDDNLNNLGISDISITGTNVVYDSGKIGKSKTTGDVILGQNLQGIVGSMSMWVYTSETSGRARIFGNDNGGQTTNRKWTLFRYPTRNDLHGWGCCNDGNTSSTSGTGSFTLSSVLPDNTWTHIAYCHNETNAYIYINGVLKADISWTSASRTFTFTDPVIIPSQIGGDKICDFRMYDHCLSPKEVKELSKGLCLHYKLDNNGAGNPNLYEGTYDFSGDKWVGITNWATHSETFNGFTVKKRLGVWGGLAQNIPCQLGDRFTISFWAKVDQGGDIRTIHRSNLGNVVDGLKIVNSNIKFREQWCTENDDGTDWKFYWATIEIISSSVTYLQWRLENSVTGKCLYISKIKLERGSTVTPWCPHTSDALYSQLGFNQNIEYDCSGYGNNGTKTTVTASSDTARHTSSSNFVSNSRITSSKGFPIGTVPIFTVNFWYKPSIGKTFGQWCDVCGCDKFRLETCNAGGTGYNWFGSFADSSGLTMFSMNESKWYMVTLVSDGVTLYQYLNGNLYAKRTLSDTYKNWTTNGSLYIGDQVMYFNMSDFRIYASALSAEEIRNIYETSISIDNTGNVLGYDILDGYDFVNANSNGTIYSKEIIENGTIASIKDNNDVTSRSFYEF